MSSTPLAIGNTVIYKTNQFIAFNKPAGMPTQPDKTGDASLWQLAEIYCKKTLYPAHRIDRPVSGLVLFAQSKSAIANLELQFQQHRVDKDYLAVVAAAPPSPAATLTHYLLKDGRQHKSSVSLEPREGAAAASLAYQLLHSSDRYHLLHIRTESGKFHQIRAQLAAAGMPIKGDVKYGARRSNPDRSIHLHAWQIAFDHPVSAERVHLVAPLPDETLWNFFTDFVPKN